MSGVMDSADPCPTEDALNTLLGYLVDPKLPSKSSARGSPSQFDQEFVAKQIHAVVLLYNYYYRKQHTHLEFLGFENFCKLAVILRPTLLVHMKLMQLSDDTELDDMEKQLSLTEKKIMDACDIATRLDASRTAPSTEGWPISKVVVFLIDLRKENCLLQFGSITEGVWSMIEQDLELPNNNLNGSMDSNQVNKKTRFIRKPFRNESDANEAVHKQLAFSAVKEATGINERDLMILEKHVVYSMSKEKAAACFYIMQCTLPNNNHIIQIPIEDAINSSLQGPLFVRSSSQWMHTKVVEYFHLLPYAEILSDWLAREMLPNSSQVQRVGSKTINVNSSKKFKKPCESEVPEKEELGSKTGSGSTKQNEDDGSRVIELLDDGLCNMEVDNSFVIHTQTKERGSDVSSKVPHDNYQKMTTSIDGCLHGLTDGATADSLKRQRLTECGDGTGTVVVGDRKCNNISSDQDGMPINDSGLVKHQSNSNDLDKMHTIIASRDQELSQAALRVILSKRAKLCFQLRDIQDQIAQCDKNMQIILNGGEGNLAVKIESLIEGCSDVSLRSLSQDTTYQHGKDQSLPQFIKSIPSTQNPCQELDDLCYQNNWILPTYSVTAIDGGFQAKVIVKGIDFEYSSDGDLHLHPREARDSAAAQMLVKLLKEPNMKALKVL
ncbi:hypothetical protein P3X46_000532 [Hevea brasiliensis]|uniref:DRBM domain-containing protein n=1 Tax=Hevea brasiliensis TaxID=3981 RepID=A0ABQ9NAB6_HEVBR|nr:uncharacterized protein LOC110649241 isoform X3 [Hevea brasiliensis]XP_058000856.1 uncharacterized protein LOC110649241 isoform X3 [Hevea brasiliensis]XP_058000863.1 uncharacterized protein LOC110649241 isoform X3 [Hevea brasiliensis]KAJ9189209.1 hypothetical protein P3X46_000532 [Hevea brasiliensis]